jgi:tripartite-type tricarboxylate transporter receptor subunit TctC
MPRSSGCLAHRVVQPYPIRPVRVVLGLSPGGSVDIVTRIVAQALSEF